MWSFIGSDSDGPQAITFGSGGHEAAKCDCIILFLFEHSAFQYLSSLQHPPLIKCSLILKNHKSKEMIRMDLKQSHLAAAITKLPHVIAFDFLLEVIRMALKQSHLAAAITKLPNVIAFYFCFGNVSGGP